MIPHPLYSHVCLLNPHILLVMSHEKSPNPHNIAIPIPTVNPDNPIRYPIHFLTHPTIPIYHKHEEVAERIGGANCGILGAMLWPAELWAALLSIICLACQPISGFSRCVWLFDVFYH